MKKTGNKFIVEEFGEQFVVDEFIDESINEPFFMKDGEFVFPDEVIGKYIYDRIYVNCKIVIHTFKN